jgi:hypothetical protein
MRQFLADYQKKTYLCIAFQKTGFSKDKPNKIALDNQHFKRAFG